MSGQDSVNRIREAARKTVELIAHMDACMKDVENELVEMGLGLEETVADGGVSLSFQKSRGAWSICVVTDTVHSVWKDASRELKLAAFGLLPRLMIALEFKANRMLGEYQEVVTRTCNSIKFEKK